MAKLSVYNTIDRSQLGGKFVPLIQSGVNNYKILASDLGKEYSPGDAIEITDTGVINVNYDPSTLRLSSSGLGVRTDHARGVFDGADGIYINSADSTIDISSYGIKVNTESLIGPGLELHAGNMISVKTKAPLYTYDHGVSLSIGGDLYVTNEGALYVNSAAIRDSAKQHVYKYIGNSLSVDQGYLVVNTNYIASGFGLTTGYGEYGPISVDIEDVASAIGNNYIGSGLYFNNSTYTFSANVNTATGIIVKDNKLYLNSGDGLQTSNNTLSVKLADNSIAVLAHDGIKVNTGYGLSATSDGLYVKSADNSIDVYADGIKVNTDNNTLKTGAAGLYVDTYYVSGAIAGNGLKAYHDGTLYVSQADNFIYSDSIGVGLNAYNLYSHMDSVSSNIEYRSSYLNAIVAKADDGTKIKSLYSGSGISINNIGYNLGYINVNVDNSKGLCFDKGKLTLYAHSGSLGFSSTGELYVKDKDPGWGLESRSGTYYVKSADSSIGVSDAGIKVNPSALVGQGLTVHSDGHLGVKIGPGLTTHGAGELAVDTSYLTDGGNLKVSSSGYLYASATGLAGYGLKAADDFDKKLDVNAKAPIYADQYGVALRIGGCLDVDKNGRLYVRSGSGLGEDNGILHVQAHDNSIEVVSTTGIRVNTGYGLSATSEGLYVKSANKSIDVSGDGIKVNVGPGLIIAHDGISVYTTSGLLVGSDGVRVNLNGSTNIKTSNSEYLYASATYMAGYGLESGNSDTRLSVKAANNSIDVTQDGIKVNPLALAGYGLAEYSKEKLYVLTANSSIDVSSNGIKVNPSALVGPGLKNHGDSHLMVHAIAPIYVDQYGVALKVGGCLTVKNGGLYVRSGSGLGENNGILYVKTGDGLGVDSYGSIYASSSYTVGLGLTHVSGELQVLPADNSIGVSNGGIKVNVGSGLGVDSSGVCVNTGYGLSASSDLDGLGVKSANNSIGVSEDGIKVNAGYGLSTTSGGLYVKSADNSIGVSYDGIKVNTINIAGDGLGGANNTLYVNSAWLAGHGLMSNASGKLEIYCGSGLALDTSSGKVYVTSAVNPDFGKGLWLASDNDSLLSVYAGSGLMFDTRNRVSVYAGSGLTLVGPEGEASLQVKAGDNNTISVLESGIEVNAGPGLCYAGSLYIQSADRSINVATDGITVNYGDGLFMNDASKLAVNAGSGLQVSEIEKKLTVYAGSGLGFDTYGDSLEVKNADNSISVTSDGIKVAEGFGTPDYSSVVTLSKTVNKVQQAPADGTLMVTYNGSNQDSSFGKYQVNICNADGTTITIGVLAGRAGYEGSCSGASCPISKGTYFKVTLWSGIAGDANFIFVPNIKG